MDLTGKLYPERAYAAVQPPNSGRPSDQSPVGYVGRIGSTATESSIMELFNKTQNELIEESRTLMEKINADRSLLKMNSRALSDLNLLKKKIDYFVFNAGVFHKVTDRVENFNIKILSQSLNEVRDFLHNKTSIIFNDGTVLEVDTIQLKEQEQRLFCIFDQHFAIEEGLTGVIEIEGRSVNAVSWILHYLGIKHRHSPENPSQSTLNNAKAAINRNSNQTQNEENSQNQFQTSINQLQVANVVQDSLVVSTHKRTRADEPQRSKRIKTETGGENNHRFDALKALARIEPDLVFQLLQLKDSDGKTILDEGENRKVILPFLLNALSEENLESALSTRNSKGHNLLDDLSEEMLKPLSNMQLFRLCNFFQSTHSATQNELHTFAGKYIEFLQKYPWNPVYPDPTLFSLIIHEIKQLANLTGEDKFAALANYISFNAIPLRYIEDYLTEDEFLSIVKHIRYVDLEFFGNISLARRAVQNCLNLQCLRISDSRILDGIKELPFCEDFTCNDCDDLTGLPAMPLCKVFASMNCVNLTRLPQLPLCRELYIYGCSSLKSLPPLYQCEEAYFDNCTNLEDVPYLKKCTKLFCPECVNLTHLPDLPVCKHLNCNGCTILSQLPPLPRCTHLEYHDCPGIWEMPQVPFNAQVYSSVEYCQMNVDIERISTEPVMVLVELGSFLLFNKPFPNICLFKDGKPSLGIDYGGVRRDFLSLLFAKLFKEDFTDDDVCKFLSIEDGVPYSRHWNVIEQQAYLTLGALLSICLNSEFKIGPRFSDLFYQCLISRGEVIGYDNTPEKKWILNCYFRLIAKNSFNKLEQLLDNRAEIESLSKQERDTLIYLFNLSSDSMLTNEFIKNPNESSLYSLMEKILQDERIRPMYNIAIAMKSKLGERDWTTIQDAQDPQKLRREIEGVINAKTLKEKLSWQFDGDDNDPRYARTKIYLNHWIDQNSETVKLSLFIRAVTGNIALGNKKLLIQVFDGKTSRAPSANTCFFVLNLWVNYENQEKFNEMLEYLFADMTSDTGFSTG